MLFLETYLPRSRRGWFRHSFRTSAFFVYFYFTFLKKCHMRWKPRMMGSFCTIGCFHLISGCKVMTLSRHFPTLIGLVEFVTPLFALLGFFALLGLKATVAWFTHGFEATWGACFKTMVFVFGHFLCLFGPKKKPCFFFPWFFPWFLLWFFLLIRGVSLASR